MSEIGLALIAGLFLGFMLGGLVFGVLGTYRR